LAIDISTQTMRLITPDGAIIEGSDTLQGTWTVEQYVRLTDHADRLLEFTDGELELLPMPTDKHQVIIAFLYRLLFPYMDKISGVILFAALRLHIRAGKFREPDLMLLLDANDPRRQNAYWLGADMVIEIVSADDPQRDTIVKRADYAEGRIPEYWIVNPTDETVTVLSLADEGQEYAGERVFRRGEVAISALLPDFSVQVSAIFDAR
jgi:Uma2 family endonuclease